jgi:hypothetical protein
MRPDVLLVAAMFCFVAKIIQTSRSGFSRLFAGLRRSYAYRWYEVVEGASF